MIRWHQPMGENGLLGRFVETFWVWTSLYIVFGLVLMEWILDASTGVLALTSAISGLVAVLWCLIDVRLPSKRGTHWPIEGADEPARPKSTSRDLTEDQTV